MRSVADQLREETRRRSMAMAAAERLELALRLGDDDVALLRAAQALSDAEARLAIQRTRQSGRAPSACARR